MSASERLAALDAALTSPPSWRQRPGALASQSGQYVSGLTDSLPVELVDLRDALPEIVAVVRAAEVLSEGVDVGEPLGDALAALDAKLSGFTKSVQTSLEPKPE